MNDLNFKFVLLDDDGNLLTDSKNKIIQFDDSKYAMQFNKEKDYKYHVMQYIPEMDIRYIDGRIEIRKK